MTSAGRRRVAHCKLATEKLIPSNPDLDEELYYRARCRCGWFGESRERAYMADVDYREHRYAPELDKDSQAN